MIGVHVWFDIAGGIATAGLGYAIATAFSRKKQKAIGHEKTIPKSNETSRQLIHIGIGILISLGLWVNLNFAFYTILIGALIGMLIIQLKLMKFHVPIADYMLDRFERKHAFPGKGSMFYALGVLFIIGLLRTNTTLMISLILILSLGDGLATWIGKNYGRHKLTWNRDKTFEGTVSFLIGCIPSLFIVPSPITGLVIVTAAFIESLPLRIDDNILIPVIGSIIYFYLLL